MPPPQHCLTKTTISYCIFAWVKLPLDRVHGAGFKLRISQGVLGLVSATVSQIKWTHSKWFRWQDLNEGWVYRGEGRVKGRNPEWWGTRGLVAVSLRLSEEVPPRELCKGGHRARAAVTNG